MAKPIRETPILYGKEAEKFLKAIANPKKISKEELERMKENYEKIKKKSKILCDASWQTANSIENTT